MFELDPRLAADTVELVRWPLCRVLLMNDANYPWLILVPAKPDLRDIDQLGESDRQVLIDEIARASGILRKIANPYKLNVAALGNQVAQLHVHVIARFTTDPAWPRPVWGVVPARRYDDAALATFKERFTALANG
ncbi:MAG TPA: HIT domain-containing protein [Alphaproteobacteria bacterium]